ncbi:Rrf2 family transcriptional regulator [soil metagenome]
MLSKKSKYAIKALLALARNAKEENFMRISQISEEEHIPRKFLEAILVDLKKQGFLKSKLGANGGYFLAKPADQIVLSQIMRLTDGPIALLPCVSLNYYERCDDCDDEVSCGIRKMALQIRDASLEILNNTTIADLLAKEKKGASRKGKKK